MQIMRAWNKNVNFSLGKTFKSVFAYPAYRASDESAYFYFISQVLTSLLIKS